MGKPNRRKRQSRDGSAPKRRRIVSEPKHFDLLRWRVQQGDAWTPEGLAASLTVEGLPDWCIPAERVRQVVAFRHLRSDQRVSVCRSFLEASRPAEPVERRSATTLYDFIVEDGHRLLDEATDRMLSASFPRPIDPDILARVDASHAAHTERASFRERVRDLAYDDETRLSVLDRADVLDGAAAELRREHERAKRGAK